MITDEELAALPEDPELAFVEFERIIRARLQKQEERANSEQRDANLSRLEYMNKVLAAAKEFEIGEIGKYSLPRAGSSSFYEAYGVFLTAVDHFTTKVRIRQAPRNRQGSVGLDGNTKAKIHHYIEQIRGAIEAAELPDKKRDSLYGKLERFALEVDRNRTSLEAAMAVYIAVCDGIGQGFQKLEPARKWVDSVGVLLGRAKEVEDDLRPGLPKPTVRKQIEAPAKTRTLSSDLDEEIPF